MFSHEKSSIKELGLLAIILMLLFLTRHQEPTNNHQNQLVRKVRATLVPSSPSPVQATVCRPATLEADLSKLKNQVYWRTLVNQVKSDESTNYSIPTNLVLAMMQQESGGNNNAQSNSILKGALGAMQIGNLWINIWSHKTPSWLSKRLLIQGYTATDAGFNATEIKDYLATPEGQIVASLHIFDEALSRWQGNIYAALAEYNGGFYAGQLWSQWSRYAQEQNINPLDVGNPHYRQLKEEAVQNLSRQLRRQGYTNATTIASNKIYEAQLYVKIIVPHWLKGAQSCYLPRASRVVVPINPRVAEKTVTISYFTYKVKSGDSLSAIASRYQTTVSVLLGLNPQIRNANLIRVGQKIKVPKK